MEGCTGRGVPGVCTRPVTALYRFYCFSAFSDVSDSPGSTSLVLDMRQKGNRKALWH